MDNETKKMFELLINKIDTISARQESMNESLNIMNERLNSMEIRQDEIFSVIKAIEHSNTTHKAEIDNITHRLAHTEGTINKIGNVIIESRAVK